MKSKQIFSMVSCLLILGSAISCKQNDSDDPNAKVKTLNSIASGLTKFEQCKGSNVVQIQDDKIIFDKEDPKPITDESKKTEIRKAVKDYFSALPDSVQTLFLKKMGGNIFISSRVNSLCEVSHTGRNLDSSNKEAMSGCFNFVQDPDKQQASIFTLVHSQDPEKIRYYGPQIFGYLYAQFYPRLAMNSAKTNLEILETEPMQLVTLKEKVANAFLSDMLSNSAFDVAILKNILGTNSVAELKSTSSVPPMNRLSFKMGDEISNPEAAVKESRRKQVLDYVYANAYQSMHCTAETKSSAIKDFDRTHVLFDEVDVAIDNLSRSLIGAQGSAQARKTASSGSTDLNLEGGSIMDILAPFLGGLGNLGGDSGNSGQGNQQQNFSNVLNNNNGNSSGPSIDTTQKSSKFGSLYAALANGGCSNCGVNGCNGNCCGGGCSNCDGQGSCPGGCCGGCCSR